MVMSGGIEASCENEDQPCKRGALIFRALRVVEKFRFGEPQHVDGSEHTHIQRFVVRKACVLPRVGKADVSLLYKDSEAPSPISWNCHLGGHLDV